MVNVANINRLVIDRRTNTGTCYYCGGMVVQGRQTMTAKSKVESEMILDKDFVCIECGAEYHAEIGAENGEIKEREILLERKGEVNLLGNTQKELWR